MLPPCFVLMPFGRNPLARGISIDFDTVFRDLIEPAIATTGMKPLRCANDGSRKRPRAICA